MVLEFINYTKINIFRRRQNMMTFTLSNEVLMPAVGIGTFLMSPDQAEQAVCDALACGYRMIDE